VLLYQALGFSPPAFAHLALVMGPDHTPLSKRHGATSVAEFRRTDSAGSADELPRVARMVAGRRSELLPIDEPARRFAIEDVGQRGHLRPGEARGMNRHYMKMAAPRGSRRNVRVLSRARYLRRRSDDGMEYLS
jgi:glutamyl/glutaminyl-tRNA synthetase